MRLTDKVAVITGAAQGMGAVEAALLAKEGAKVIATDTNERGGSDVVEGIKRDGGDATFVQQDVRVEEDWHRVLATAEERYGPVTVLVNNAGVQGGRASLLDTSGEMWRTVMDVNAMGVFLGMKTVIPVMREAGGGSVINISSVSGIAAALYPQVETTPNAAYYASKSAVRILTKLAAAQCGRWGVRVNSVHPGFIAAPMSQDSLQDPERVAYFKSVIPMQRWGRPEDVAHGVLYLASDEAGFVNGAELVIDGGYVCKA